MANLAGVSKNGVIDKDKEYEVAVDYKNKLKTKCPSVEQNVGNLSGGNQQKVIIAREVTNDSELMIAFNPTRGLDVGAIEFVHKYLVQQRDKNRAILLVSFELDEIMGLSDIIDVIFDGQVVGSMEGKNADENTLGFMMAGGHKDE